VQSKPEQDFVVPLAQVIVILAANAVCVLTQKVRQQRRRLRVVRQTLSLVDMDFSFEGIRDR
jgi:hypothetical protein